MQQSRVFPIRQGPEPPDNPPQASLEKPAYHQLTLTTERFLGQLSLAAMRKKKRLHKDFPFCLRTTGIYVIKPNQNPTTPGAVAQGSTAAGLTPMNAPPSLSQEELGTAVQKLDALASAMNQVLFGKENLIELILTGVLARGHILLEGLPGLGKTELVKGLSKALDITARRVQFTPDLLPGDITGTPVLQEADGRKSFVFQEGPVFANIMLADEINRASPKTQSALLEAMQERRVTVMGRTFTLLPPFFVLATQNPIEQEGTYPLPEAQLDRFMFLIEVDYPTEDEEMRIARETTGNRSEELKHILSGDEIIFYQDLVRRVPVPEHIYEYAVKLVRSTRPSLDTSPEWVKQYVAWGAGPRAVQFLILGAKTRAALQGSYIVRKEDIDAIVEPVLMHRVVTNFAAESQGITPRKAVARLAAEV